MLEGKGRKEVEEKRKQEISDWNSGYETGKKAGETKRRKEELRNSIYNKFYQLISDMKDFENLGPHVADRYLTMAIAGLYSAQDKWLKFQKPKGNNPIGTPIRGGVK